MKTITLADFLQHQDFYIDEAKAGKIFIYPTDTIYGIGGLYIPENVEKVFTIKHRDSKKMFSIIAPSFERIQEKFPQADIEKMKEQLNQYHGVTYIFDYTKPGMRIIKHPMQDFVKQLGEGFITTSCNIEGNEVMTEVSHIPEEIASKVDYIIDGGTGGGKPSVLIDFVSNKVIER